MSAFVLATIGITLLWTGQASRKERGRRQFNKYHRL